MENPITNSLVIAGALAGTTIGFAQGFATKGQSLEQEGAGFWQQAGGSLGQGALHSVTGAAIGAGAGGTALALKKMLGK